MVLRGDQCSAGSEFANRPGLGHSRSTWVSRWIYRATKPRFGTNNLVLDDLTAKSFDSQGSGFAIA